LPLEAQRLGLESYASDLNPVAVLINKAMIEIPPKFAGRPPVNPEARKEQSLIAKTWRGVQGKLVHASPAVRSEAIILWRRVAGGLSRGQQQALRAGLAEVVEEHAFMPGLEEVRLRHEAERHEKYQEVNGVKYPFDDKEEMAKVIELLGK